MKVLKTYRNGSNALYVREQLQGHGIVSFIEEIDHKDLKFKLMVKDEDIGKAAEIVANLDIEDNDESSVSDDYLNGYMEWSVKMYDPGHYTGGKTPHYLLDKSNWKIFGPLFVLFGVTMVYLFIRKGIAADDWEALIFALLYLIAGYSMIKQLRKRRN